MYGTQLSTIEILTSFFLKWTVTYLSLEYNVVTIYLKIYTHFTLIRFCLINI